MGLNQFDFTDYDEFCKQVANCVIQTEIKGIINICSGRPEKLADRVERFIIENNLILNYNTVLSPIVLMIQKLFGEIIVKFERY